MYFTNKQNYSPTLQIRTDKNCWVNKAHVRWNVSLRYSVTPAHVHSGQTKHGIATLHLLQQVCIVRKTVSRGNIIINTNLFLLGEIKFNFYDEYFNEKIKSLS